jgi:curved DNA-binding protein CbpA
MLGDSSAYAALGLKPGADSAAVERAYKRLIKQHHPDREGGDSKRAAEINRAYRELRKAPPVAAVLEKDALELHDDPQLEARDPFNRWMLGAMLVVAAVGALVLAQGPVRPLGSGGSAGRLAQASGTASPMDPMDQPLDLAGIDSAARDARHIARTRDEMGLSAASEACHQELRAHPSLLQLDRCAAFDDAAVLLQDRDPLRDRGPFSELAVTGRQWSAASALSSDYLAIDGRLDRIRLRVEMVLAPVMMPDSN